MKIKSLTAFLTFLFLIIVKAPAFAQNVLDTKITLYAKNEDIRKVLSLIEDQARIKFAYSGENLKYDKLSINYQEENLSQVL